jgi:hypothetical protein
VELLAGVGDVNRSSCLSALFWTAGVVRAAVELAMDALVEKMTSDAAKASACTKTTMSFFIGLPQKLRDAGPRPRG